MDYRLRNNNNVPKSTGKRKKLVRMPQGLPRNLSKCPSCEEVISNCNCKATGISSINASSKITCSPAVDNNCEDSIGRRLSRRRGSSLYEKNIPLIKKEQIPQRRSEENKACINIGGLNFTPKKEKPEEGNLMFSETDLSVSEGNVNKESICCRRRISRKTTSVGSANDEGTECISTSDSVILPKRTTRLSVKFNQIPTPEIVPNFPTEKIDPIVAAPKITRRRSKKKCDMFDKFNDHEPPDQIEEVTCTNKLPREDTYASSAFDKNICARNRNASGAEDNMVYSAEMVKAIGQKPLPQESFCNDSEIEKLNLPAMNSKVELGDCKINSGGRCSEKKCDNSFVDTAGLQLRKTVNLSKAKNIDSLSKQNEIFSSKMDEKMSMLSVADKVVTVEINSALTTSISSQTNTDLSFSVTNTWEIEKTSAPMVTCSTQTNKKTCKSKGLQTSVDMTSRTSQISSGEFTLHKETNTDLETTKNTETITDLMALLLEQLRSESISKNQGSFPKNISESGHPHDSKLAIENNEMHDQNSSQHHQKKPSNKSVSKKRKKSHQIKKVIQTSSVQKVEEKSSRPVFQSECAVVTDISKIGASAPVIGSESKSKLDQTAVQGDGSTTFKISGSSLLIHGSSKNKFQKSTFLKDMDTVEGIDHSETSEKKDSRKSVMGKVIGESNAPLENISFTKKGNAKDCDYVVKPSSLDVNLEFAFDGNNLKNSSKTIECDENISSTSSTSSENKKFVHPSRCKRVSSSEKWEGSSLKKDIKTVDRSKGHTFRSTKSPTTVSGQDLKTRVHSAEGNASDCCSGDSVNVAGISGSEKWEGSPSQKDTKRGEKSKSHTLRSVKSPTTVSGQDLKMRGRSSEVNASDCCSGDSVNVAGISGSEKREGSPSQKDTKRGEKSKSHTLRSVKSPTTVSGQDLKMRGHSSEVKASDCCSGDSVNVAGISGSEKREGSPSQKDTKRGEKSKSHTLRSVKSPTTVSGQDLKMRGRSSEVNASDCCSGDSVNVAGISGSEKREGSPSQKDTKRGEKSKSHTLRSVKSPTTVSGQDLKMRGHSSEVKASDCCSGDSVNVAGISGSEKREGSPSQKDTKRGEKSKSHTLRSVKSPTTVSGQDLKMRGHSSEVNASDCCSGDSVNVAGISGSEKREGSPSQKDTKRGEKSKSHTLRSVKSPTTVSGQDLKMRGHSSEVNASDCCSGDSVNTLRSAKSPTNVSLQDLKTRGHSSDVNASGSFSDNVVNVGGISGSELDSARLKKSSKEKCLSNKCMNGNSMKSDGVPKSSISLGGFRSKRIEGSVDHTLSCESDNGLTSVQKSLKINTDNYSQREKSRNEEGNLGEVKKGVEEQCQSPPDTYVEAPEIKIEVEDQYYCSKDDDDIISIYGDGEFDDLFDGLDGHQSSLFDHAMSKKCSAASENAKVNDNQFTLSRNYNKDSLGESDMIKRLNEEESSGSSRGSLTEYGRRKELIDYSNNDVVVSEEKGNAVEGNNIGVSSRSYWRDDGGKQNEVRLPSENLKEADIDVNHSESEKESDRVQLDSSKKIVMANLLKEESVNEVPKESANVQLDDPSKTMLMANLAERKSITEIPMESEGDPPKKMFKANLVEKKSLYEIPQVSVTGSDIIMKNVEKRKPFEEEAEPKAVLSKQPRITGTMHAEDREENSVIGFERGKLQSRNCIQPPRNIPSLGLDSSTGNTDFNFPVPVVLKGICFKYMRDLCSCRHFKHKYPVNFLQKVEVLNSWDIYHLLRFAVTRRFRRFLNEHGAKIASILARRKEANFLVDFVMEYRRDMRPTYHFWCSILQDMSTCENCSEVSVADTMRFIVNEVLKRQNVPERLYLLMLDLIIVKSCSFKNSNLSCEVLNCLTNDHFSLKEPTIEMSLKRCFTILSGPDRNVFCLIIGKILSNAYYHVPLLDNTKNLYGQLVYHLKRNGEAVLAETLKNKLDGRKGSTTQSKADPDKAIFTVSSGGVICEEFAKSSEECRSSQAQRLEPQNNTHVHLKRHLEDKLDCNVPSKKALMSSDQSEKYKPVNSFVSSNYPVELQPCEIQFDSLNTEIQSSSLSESTNHSNSYFPHGSSSSSPLKLQATSKLQPPARSLHSSEVWDKTAGDQAENSRQICSPIYPIPTVMSCQVQQAEQNTLLFYDKNASANIWSGGDSSSETQPPLFEAQNVTKDSVCSISQNIQQISVNSNTIVPKRDDKLGFHQNIPSGSVRKSSNSAGTCFSCGVEEQNSCGKFMSSDIVIQIPLQDNLDAMGTKSVRSSFSSESSFKCVIDETQSEHSVSRFGSSGISVSDLNKNSTVLLSEKALEEALNENNWTARKILSTFGPWLTSSELEKELPRKLCEILEQDFAAAVSSIQSLVNFMGTMYFIRLKQSGKIKKLIETVIFNLILKMVISDVWAEAHQLLTVANSAKLSILFSEAFIDEEISISRKMLVFSEICFRVQEMEQAINYLSEGNLFGASTSEWKYDSLEGDLEIQVILLTSLICKLATGGYAAAAPSTFLKVYNSQNSLSEPVDLLAHANKVIVCALNGNCICPAYEVYLTLGDLAILPKPTYRAILIGLILNKKFPSAREVHKKIAHLEIYPSFNVREIPCEILIHSYWRKEEIFIILDDALGMMCESGDGRTDFQMKLLIRVCDAPEDLNVAWMPFKEATSEESLDPVPHSLALASNSLEDIHTRVVCVLEKMLYPPIQFGFTVIEEGLEELFTLHPLVLVNHLYSRYCGGKGFSE